MKKSSLTKILIDWECLFHDINLKNNGAIIIPRFSTIRYVDKFARVLMTYVKHLPWSRVPLLSSPLYVFGPLGNKLKGPLHLFVSQVKLASVLGQQG